MRVIIAGSREFNDYDLLCKEMEKLRQSGHIFTEVVSGTARGADRLGERWARQKGLRITRFPAQWEKYGKSAGYRRNAEMAENTDFLVAFWDGVSKGTAHMINIAEEKRLYCIVVRTDRKEDQ